MTRSFFLDGLMKAQEQTARWWQKQEPQECDGCGKPLTDDEPDEWDWRIKHDCGERDHVKVCYECIKRGWHTWGDPRT